MIVKKMDRSHRMVSLTTALVAGLGWGWLFGFLDGLPNLLEGAFLQDARVRLQALAFLICLYVITLTLLFGILGLLLILLPNSVRRRFGRRSLFAAFSGLAVAIWLPLTWFSRFNFWPSPPEQGLSWVLPILLGGVVGIILGKAIATLGHWWQSGRGILRPARWARVWRTTLMASLLPMVALLLLFGYRQWFRDQPWLLSKGGFPATPEQPNIVLISIDALRADHLGVYGYPGEISPHIDALAQQGVLFKEAFSQAPWTMASVGSFMTSLYPAELKIICTENDCRDIRVDEQRVMLAEILRQEGYTTAAVIVNGWLTDERGFCQGFDLCVDFHPPKPFDLPHIHRNSLPSFIWHFVPRIQGLLWQVYYDLFDPSLFGPGWEVSARGNAFIHQYQGQRFFLWLHYIDPHAPYNPKEPFFPLSAEVEPSWLAWQWWQWLGDTADQNVFTEADIEALRSLYAGDVHDADAAVGAILDQLATLGLSDRTVVVITSDHGEEFDEHGDFSHGQSLYRELVHVPLIIAGPPVNVPGSRVDTPVALLDILPTLTEIAGGSVPPEAHGQSLMPFLRGEEGEARPVFSESVSVRRPHEYKAMRWQQYVLIYNTIRGDVEFYDRLRDPGEQSNQVKMMPVVVQSLLPELWAWTEETARLAAQLATAGSITEIDEQMLDALDDLGY